MVRCYLLSSSVLANFASIEIIIRGVCLDRSPGFKPSDVDAALIEAVKVGTSVAY